jgi:predicted MFS family arabinose efflux permease
MMLLATLGTALSTVFPFPINHFIGDSVIWTQTYNQIIILFATSLLGFAYFIHLMLISQ